MHCLRRTGLRTGLRTGRDRTHQAGLPAVKDEGVCVHPYAWRVWERYIPGRYRTAEAVVQTAACRSAVFYYFGPVPPADLAQGVATAPAAGVGRHIPEPGEHILEPEQRRLRISGVLPGPCRH